MSVSKIERVSDLAYEAARRFDRKIAFIETDGTALSFAEIDDRAGRVAGTLDRHGIGPGDRVVLHLPNGWHWVVAYHAIVRVGAIVVPANFLLTPQEVTFIAENSRATAIVVPAAKRAFFPQDLKAFTVGAAADAVSFDDMLEGPYRAPVECLPDDLVCIGYTSGTTGRPKGAMTTHRGYFACLAGTATIHVRTAHDIVVTALPFSHVYGSVVLNCAFVTGGTIVTSARFDASAALRCIAERGATLFEGVPTMYYQMLAQPEIATANLRSLTRCTVGGQTMPRAMIDAVVERFGCPLLELWGMTEVGGPAITQSPYWVPRPGSIGLPIPGTAVRIADLDDKTRSAPDGAAGELLVKGPLVTPGYWRDPEATSAAIDSGGWLATGDIVRMDADGHLFVVDRRKDIIITAGYNIYPAEIEQVVAMHPAVVMTAVAGIADDEKGELAYAFVVRRRDTHVDEAEIGRHCRNHLASYKIPKRIIFVDDLPRNSTGKILRRNLSALMDEGRATSE